MGEGDERDGGEVTAQPEASAPAVDLTLIDEMLRLSPGERLRQNDRMAALAARLRRWALDIAVDRQAARSRPTAAPSRRPVTRY
jgi:hypothetical protein